MHAKPVQELQKEGGFYIQRRMKKTLSLLLRTPLRNQLYVEIGRKKLQRRLLFEFFREDMCVKAKYRQDFDGRLRLFTEGTDSERPKEKMEEVLLLNAANRERMSLGILSVGWYVKTMVVMKQPEEKQLVMLYVDPRKQDQYLMSRVVFKYDWLL